MKSTHTRNHFKPIRLIYAGATLAVLANACGKTEDVAQSLQEGASIQGSFHAEVKGEFGVRVAGLGCVSQTIDIGGQNFTMIQTLFADANCQGPALGNIVTETTFDTGNELAIAPGAREIDLTIKKVTVTSLNDKWGQTFGIDVTGQCNISGLPVNGTLEVTGLDCGSFGTFPVRDAVYFTSYVHAENTLTFTQLPQEKKENIGTVESPAPRNLTLTTHYVRH